MIRTLLVIIFIAFAVSVLIPLGRDGTGGDNRDEERSPPQITVSSVQDLGPIENDPGIRFRDCGYSANFQGRSIWIFGDTFLTIDNAEGQRLLCNSWSSTYDIDAGDGIAGFSERMDEVGAPVAFFPMTAEELAFNALHTGESCAEEPCGARWAIWPGTIVADPGMGWAYIFYHKIYSEPGLLNFFHVGHSIAVWKDFEAQPERPLFGHSDKYPSLFFTEGKEGFGSAAFLQANTLYIYGCELDRESLTKPCRLARVPIASILDKSAWTFYSGSGNWSSNLNESEIVFNGNEMMSVFYSSYVSAYIAVYSKPMSHQVMLRASNSPEGPWSSPVEVFVAKDSATELGWIYDALAHPELSQDNGRIIYITYSRNTAAFDSELRLVTVELAPAP
jgi:hypothetical protein